MKKYIVMRVFSTLAPSGVFMTDIKEDATTYAEIMARTDGNEYAVAEVIFQTNKEE